MKKDDISPLIREKAPLILAEIKKAKSILLHCHPSPDPDSVGSALAMKFALESLGKKATVIRGDSEIPQAFMHFPGADQIVPKNFGEVDLKEFDLFISLDSSNEGQISRLAPVTFPLPICSVVIDHHENNVGYADVDLVVPGSPAVAEMLFDLFKLWNVPLNSEIAPNLFIGIYTDTGGFKYAGVTPYTFAVASELAALIPNIPMFISDMENSNEPSSLSFQGLGLSLIEPQLGGTFALAAIPYKSLVEKGIPADEASPSIISGIIRSVRCWNFGGALVEVEPNKVRGSFRSKDGEAFDMSKLATALGGGGHKGAAGVTLNMPLDEAKRQVVAKAKELYNL